MKKYVSWFYALFIAISLLALIAWSLLTYNNTIEKNSTNIPDDSKEYSELLISEFNSTADFTATQFQNRIDEIFSKNPTLSACVIYEDNGNILFQNVQTTSDWLINRLEKEESNNEFNGYDLLGIIYKTETNEFNTRHVRSLKIDYLYESFPRMELRKILTWAMIVIAAQFLLTFIILLITNRSNDSDIDNFDEKMFASSSSESTFIDDDSPLPPIDNLDISDSEDLSSSLDDISLNENDISESDLDDFSALDNLSIDDNEDDFGVNNFDLPDSESEDSDDFSLDNLDIPDDNSDSMGMGNLDAPEIEDETAFDNIDDFSLDDLDDSEQLEESSETIIEPESKLDDLDDDLSEFSLDDMDIDEDSIDDLGIENDSDLPEEAIDSDDLGLDDLDLSEETIDSDDLGLDELDIPEETTDSDDLGLDDLDIPDETADAEAEEISLDDFDLQEDTIESDDLGLDDLDISEDTTDSDELGLDDLDIPDETAEAEAEAEEISLDDFDLQEDTIESDDLGLDDLDISEDTTDSDDLGLDDLDTAEETTESNDLGLDDLDIPEETVDSEELDLDDLDIPDADEDAEEIGFDDIELPEEAADSDDLGLDDLDIPEETTDSDIDNSENDNFSVEDLDSLEELNEIDNLDLPNEEIEQDTADNSELEELSEVDELNLDDFEIAEEDNEEVVPLEDLGEYFPENELSTDEIPEPEDVVHNLEDQLVDDDQEDNFNIDDIDSDFDIEDSISENMDETDPLDILGDELDSDITEAPDFETESFEVDDLDFDDNSSNASSNSEITAPNEWAEKLQNSLVEANESNNEITVSLIDIKNQSDSNSRQNIIDELNLIKAPEDTIFETETGMGIIQQNGSLEESITLMDNIVKKYPESDLVAGVSSRNGREIDSTQLIKETESSITRANSDKRVIGFQADPEKFKEIMGS